MSIFKRVRDISMAAVHEVLDSIENPEAMLHQYIRDLEEEIRNGKKAIVQETSRLKEWEAQVRELVERISKRERQAKLAIENGDEVIARKALKDQDYCESKRDELQAFIDKAKIQLEQLEQQLQQMNEKYKELCLKKDLILSRKTISKTMCKMNEAFYSSKSEEADKGFQRMEEKLRKLESESETVKKFHQLYNEFDEKYIQDERIEEKLTKLKEKQSV